MTDISNFPFPSSFQNTETRYFLPGQSLHIKQEFAKGVFRNITEFFKAWITTDSIKIFSIAFCALVTVYCTCKTAKDAFRIVLYVTALYMQHCAAARQL